MGFEQGTFNNALIHKATVPKELTRFKSPNSKETCENWDEFYKLD